jgi:hypothetical protein
VVEIPVHDRRLDHIALGKTYRVFNYTTILERRRAAGMEWVIRTKGVRFVHREGGEVVSVPPTDSEGDNVSVGGPPTVSVGEPPTDSVPPYRNSFRNKTEESSSSPSSVVVEALRAIDPGTDDDGAAQLVEASRKACPDATDEEIAHFTLLKGSSKGIKQPLAFLKTAVPKCLQGESLRLYRRDVQQARKAQAQRDRLEREHWQRVLDNPGSDEQSRAWAREALALPAKE